MALINCPECNKEISDNAASCPNCGVSRFAIKQKTMSDDKIELQMRRGKMLKITSVIVFVLGIAISIYVSGIYYLDSAMRGASAEARKLYREMIDPSWDFMENPSVFVVGLIITSTIASAIYLLRRHLQKHLK